jgi:hypothetical protein
VACLELVQGRACIGNQVIPRGFCEGALITTSLMVRLVEWREGWLGCFCFTVHGYGYRYGALDTSGIWMAIHILGICICICI